MDSREKAIDVVLIEQLNARTTFALDGLLPPETLADCFTPDGRMSVVSPDGSELENCRGHAALAEAGQRIASPDGARHYSLNVMVDVDGDNAQLRAYGIVMSIKNGQRVLARTSHQADTLVRGPDGWRIALRVLTLDPGAGF